MSNILKSWKTSLTGLVIIGGLAYKAFTVGFDIEDAVFGLIAAGFLASKDANKSHSMEDLETPTPSLKSFDISEDNQNGHRSRAPVKT